jgi:protein-S-isoprenylcysteine O-methyltransferase Ste14
MEQKNQVRQGALKYIFILLLQRFIGVVLFFIAAGTINDIRGTTNLALYLVVSIIACVMMFSGHKETLNERSKKQENTESWDKILLPIYVLLAYFGIYFTAGMGVRFGWNSLPMGLFYAGIALYLISSVFTVWPVLENKHFEATSRIQDNRAQTVITTGPYRIVRHPGYAGIILWAVASAFMFGTIAVVIISVVIIVTIWIRTYLEDKMLREELDGYLEYSKTVRYRLLPFIW